MRFCVHAVHTIESIGKERCLLTACTATEFNDNVLVIVGVLGQEHTFESHAQLFALLL